MLISLSLHSIDMRVIVSIFAVIPCAAEVANFDAATILSNIAAQSQALASSPPGLGGALYNAIPSIPLVGSITGAISGPINAIDNVIGSLSGIASSTNVFATDALNLTTSETHPEYIYNLVGGGDGGVLGSALGVLNSFTSGVPIIGNTVNVATSTVGLLGNVASITSNKETPNNYILLAPNENSESSINQNITSANSTLSATSINNNANPSPLRFLSNIFNNAGINNIFGGGSSNSFGSLLRGTGSFFSNNSTEVSENLNSTSLNLLPFLERDISNIGLNSNVTSTSNNVLNSLRGTLSNFFQSVEDLSTSGRLFGERNSSIPLLDSLEDFVRSNTNLSNITTLSNLRESLSEDFNGTNGLFSSILSTPERLIPDASILKDNNQTLSSQDLLNLPLPVRTVRDLFNAARNLTAASGNN